MLNGSENMKICMDDLSAMQFVNEQRLSPSNCGHRVKLNEVRLSQSTTDSGLVTLDSLPVRYGTIQASGVRR